MPGTFPIVGDILEQRVVCSTGNQLGVNVTHWLVTAVTTGGASLQEMATSNDALFAPKYKPALANQGYYNGVGFTNLTLPRTLEYHSAAGAGVGTGGTNMMNPSTAGLIRWQGLLAGPANRGRIYVPFPSTTMVTAVGQPNSSYTALLNTIRLAYVGLNVIVGVGGSTSMILIIKHRPGVVPGYATVVGSSVSPGFGQQHRRGYFGQPNVSPF